MTKYDPFAVAKFFIKEEGNSFGVYKTLNNGMTSCVSKHRSMIAAVKVMANETEKNSKGFPQNDR